MCVYDPRDCDPYEYDAEPAMSWRDWLAVAWIAVLAVAFGLVLFFLALKEMGVL